MKFLLTLGACLAITVPAAAQTTPPTAPPAPPPVAVAPVAPPAPPAPVFAPIPAPDYTSDAGWLCRPGRQDACAVDQTVTVIAANGKRKTEKFKAASAPAFDCFYVYPTVSLDPTPNSDLNIGPEERQVAASQAARYEYLKRDNAGRGVVLIGHSQGASILKQLLADVIEKDGDMKRKLVAAYLIGTNVAVPPGGDVGGDFKTTRLCKSVQQYNCGVTYTTFRADSPPPANSRFGRVVMPGMVAACTNPAALGGGKAEP